MGTAAEELARLGVIVDGSGARREIALTREQLIALVNTGKLTEAAMKTAIPPTIVPPSVPTAINRVTEALHRMRQAAAQGRANAMASQIGVLDPFQGGGFGGPQLGPALPNIISQAGAAAGRAAPDFNRLRSSLTQIAISAAGIPGPVGRLASVLGQFAFGGAITVGVVAGAAAIAFAWEKMTRQSREAKEAFQKQLDVLRDLKRQQDLGPTGEAGGATRAAQGRLGAIAGELRPMNALIAGASAAGAWDYAGQLERRRTALVKEAAELQRLIVAGEKAITRTTTEEAEKREAEARRRFDEKWQRLREEADRQVELERSIAQGIARMLADAADEAEKFRRAFSTAALPDQSILSPLFLYNLEKSIQKTIDAIDGLTKRQKQLLAIGGMAAAGGGLEVLGRSGPAGGILASTIGGAMSGGAAGAAVGLLSAFTSAVLDSGRAAEESRRRLAEWAAAQRNMVREWDLTITDVREMVGTLTPLQAELERLRVQFDRLREEAVQRYINDVVKLTEVIAELDAAEAKRRLQLEAEKSSLDSIIRNAPSGRFVLEKYLRDLGAPGASGAPSGTRPRGGPTGSGRPRETTVYYINIPAGGILVNGNRSRREMVDELVAGLHEAAGTTGGAGTSLSQVLDRL